MEFNDKKIVITGASSGIGLELLKELAAVPGTQIAGVARHTDAIAELGLPGVTALSYDMSSPWTYRRNARRSPPAIGTDRHFLPTRALLITGKPIAADWTRTQDILR